MNAEAEPEKYSHARAFLQLNEARIVGGRVHYGHSLKKLKMLQRRAAHAKNGAGLLMRTAEMVQSRQTPAPLLRSSLPKKQQRKLGLLPPV